jgi:hypothetical protein
MVAALRAGREACEPMVQVHVDWALAQELGPPRSLPVAAPRGGPRSGPAEPDPRKNLGLGDGDA